MTKPERNYTQDFKIVLLSLYNDEAIGIRQLYSMLFNKGYDVKLVFLKLNLVKKYEERQRESFKNSINSTTDKELDIFADFIAKENPAT